MLPKKIMRSAEAHSLLLGSALKRVQRPTVEGDTLESEPQPMVLVGLPAGNSRNRPGDNLACAVASEAHINRG